MSFSKDIIKKIKDKENHKNDFRDDLMSFEFRMIKDTNSILNNNLDLTYTNINNKNINLKIDEKKKYLDIKSHLYDVLNILKDHMILHHNYNKINIKAETQYKEVKDDVSYHIEPVGIVYYIKCRMSLGNIIYDDRVFKGYFNKDKCLLILRHFNNRISVEVNTKGFYCNSIIMHNSPYESSIKLIESILL